MRYTNYPFPTDTYIPGQTARPTDAQLAIDAPLVPLPEENWRLCPHYLWGVDLYNHGYHWEAHEAWETLWHAAGRRGPIADFLKGLIKLAASRVKLAEGNAAGAERHLLRAKELFGGLNGERWCGLRVREIDGGRGLFLEFS